MNRLLLKNRVFRSLFILFVAILALMPVVFMGSSSPLIRKLRKAYEPLGEFGWRDGGSFFFYGILLGLIFYIIWNRKKITFNWIDYLILFLFLGLPLILAGFLLFGYLVIVIVLS